MNIINLTNYSTKLVIVIAPLPLSAETPPPSTLILLGGILIAVADVLFLPLDMHNNDDYHSGQRTWWPEGKELQPRHCGERSIRRRSLTDRERRM